MASEFAGFHRFDASGVPVLWLQDQRFKTFRVHVQFRRPLDERTAARGLLPSLLVHGTARDPDRPALARRMERLYGASVLPGTGRQGESQHLRFVLDAVAGGFLPERPDQLAAGLELLFDLMLRPKLEDGAFPAAVFEREQRQAVAAARAVRDDKGAWAVQEARRLAFAGEPMGIPDHGGIEALEALGADHPERARQDFLAKGPPLVVAMGVLPDDLPERLAPLLAELPDSTPEPVPDPVQVAPRAARAEVERTELQQSRQVLIYRLPRPVGAAARAACVLMANMLGGGPHSRLFREVREKQSLCYSIYAGGDTHKGVLTVQTGLGADAAPKVRDEVDRQLAALARGEFEEEELATAKATLLGPFAAVHDSVPWRMQFTADQWVLDEDCTPDEKMAVYRQVPGQAVAAAAAAAWLDFDYLLAPAVAQ